MIEFVKNQVYRQFKFPKASNGVELTLKSYSFINFVLKFCGLHVYSEDFSALNPMLLFTLFDVTTYIMINVNTMVMYWGNLVKVSFCLVTLGSGFQGCMKIYTCLAHTKAIKKLFRDSLEIVKTSDNPVVKQSQMMYMRWCSISLKLVSCLGIFIGVFVLLEPVLEGYMRGQRILPFGFVLPWLEPYGDPGYFLNWVHHIIQTYLTFSVLLGTLLVNINLLFHVYMQINCIMLMLHGLNLLCMEAMRGKDAKKQLEVTGYLKEIIFLHQKNSAFVNEFNEIFSLHALINVMCLVFQVTVTMVTVVSDTSWLIGYVILLMAIAQLFFECFIGTVLYKFNDHLMKKIYDISWDDMSVSDQKSLALFLCIAEHPHNLSYVFGSVDLNLFVEVMKKVYSVFMMLQNFK